MADSQRQQQLSEWVTKTVAGVKPICMAIPIYTYSKYGK